jgi:hypothetical protein
MATFVQLLVSDMDIILLCPGYDDVVHFVHSRGQVEAFEKVQ